ncbi:hypothetical protein Prum_008860 [Phytohabitans rumicis]|uniref:Uncharacterized protein n=1 Tax=Phytohabitans rumicis TaxID=1076125 RepID=A0A6V8KTV0_9ACTN|nr:hypothetical protein Prum_008860 [Phytohabitans rumicis]
MRVPRLVVAVRVRRELGLLVRELRLLVAVRDARLGLGLAVRLRDVVLLLVAVGFDHVDVDDHHHVLAAVVVVVFAVKDRIAHRFSVSGSVRATSCSPCAINSRNRDLSGNPDIVPPGAPRRETGERAEDEGG